MSGVDGRGTSRCGCAGPLPMEIPSEPLQAVVCTDDEPLPVEPPVRAPPVPPDHVFGGVGLDGARVGSVAVPLPLAAPAPDQPFGGRPSAGGGRWSSNAGLAVTGAAGTAPPPPALIVDVAPWSCQPARGGRTCHGRPPVTAGGVMRGMPGTWSSRRVRWPEPRYPRRRAAWPSTPAASARIRCCSVAATCAACTACGLAPAGTTVAGSERARACSACIVSPYQESTSLAAIAIRAAVPTDSRNRPCWWPARCRAWPRQRDPDSSPEVPVSDRSTRPRLSASRRSATARSAYC